jgi:hypothetical protein
MEEENNGYVVFIKTPHEREGKGRAHMRETWRRRITVTSSLNNTEGKTPHEKEGKGRAHMRETWRRRITVRSSLNTEGKLPMRGKGKGGHT